MTGASVTGAAGETRRGEVGARPPDWLAAGLFCLFCAGLSALTYKCAANPDFAEFQRWMVSLTTNGPVEGYRRIADYPPLGDGILYLGGRAAQFLAVPDAAVLKLTIDLFQFAAALIVVRQSGSWSLGALLFLLVTPFGGLLGYLDCLYLPFILLGLGMLEGARPALALLLFTIATLIKWQPAILCPLVLLYAASLAPKGQRVRMLIPGGLVAVATILVFRPQPVWTAFHGAVSDNLFGGQAFNVDWIVTYALEILHVGAFALSPGHTVHYLMLVLVPPFWAVVSKILFWVIYAGNFCSFALHRKRHGALLLALLAAESIQFTFNSGVHENHAFLIMILAFAAYQAGALDPLFLVLTATLAIANILAFYGLALVSGAVASLGTVILAGLQVLVCVSFIMQSHAANRRAGRIGLARPA